MMTNSKQVNLPQNKNETILDEEQFSKLVMKTNENIQDDSYHEDTSQLQKSSISKRVFPNDENEPIGHDGSKSFRVVK